MKTILRFSLLAGLFLLLSGTGQSRDRITLKYQADSILIRINKQIKGLEDIDGDRLADDYIVLLNLLSDLTADNAMPAGSDMDFFDLGTHKENPENKYLSDIWFGSFNMINRANIMLEDLDNISDVSQQQKDVILANALFYRAWGHLNLTQRFQDVPIWSRSFNKYLPLPAEPADKVLDFITADLSQAATLLPDAGKANTEITRMVVLSMLARVNLQRKNWEIALTVSDEIINSGLFALNSQWAENFTDPKSPELIWRLDYVPGEKNRFAFLTFPDTSGGIMEITATSDLTGSFEKGDPRLFSTIDSRDPDHLIIKYKDPLTGQFDIPMVRYAEILLIAAEAAANLGQNPRADELVNMVRARAGLAPVVGAGIGQVLAERRTELAFEGHRWNDLLRNGTTISTLSKIGINIGDRQLYWPMPIEPLVCNIQADFSWEMSGNEVWFYNSTNGYKYYWRFGDLRFSTENGPAHIYKDPGVYDVCLTVYDTLTDCSVEICKKIEVGTVSCDASFNQVADTTDENIIHFFNMSTGSSNLWYWNFGDGTTSTNRDPVHRYKTPDAYKVCLLIKDEKTGCGSEFCEEILVGDAGLTADFSVFVDPSSLKVAFTDYSNGDIGNWYWTFGDGSNSLKTDPIHQYNFPGVFDVTLNIRSSDGKNLDRMTKRIQVGELGCDASFFVFVDSVKNTAYFTIRHPDSTANYYWLFGDGVSSRLMNPSHVFKTAGFHTAELTVSSKIRECSDRYKEVILIGSQGIDCQADFLYQAAETGLEVKFADRSFGTDLKYLWDFGDKIKSELINPTHIYETREYYNVCLTVYAGNNIQNTSCKKIYAGPQTGDYCQAKFIYSLEEITNIVSYTDKSSGNPDTWEWKFGDGTSETAQNPDHQFEKAGYYITNMSILDSNTGCKDRAVQIINIYEEEKLKAGFDFFFNHSNLKADSYPVDYVGVTLGDAGKLKWTFGDGSVDSTTFTPTHEYDGPGMYEVCLTVSDPVTGLTDTYCDSVYVEAGTSMSHQEKDQSEIKIYPNPFTGICTIELAISDHGPAGLSIFDMTGRMVKEFNTGIQGAGKYSLQLNASDLESGCYYLMLRTGRGSVSKIISVLK